MANCLQNSVNPKPDVMALLLLRQERKNFLFSEKYRLCDAITIRKPQIDDVKKRRQLAGNDPVL